jgi:hypothetical protein
MSNQFKISKGRFRREGRYVPARLQAGLSVLERLREFPLLNLRSHIDERCRTAIQSQEIYGNRVLARLNIEPISRNHGRRSSNLPEWGQDLLDEIAASGFAKANPEERDRIISRAQDVLAKPLRDIIEQEPLEARIKGRSAEAVVHEILLQAEEKGKSGDVAQYLVGAKLALRFKREIPVDPANKSDRKSLFDKDAKLGDFEIENAVIEVAVGLPDDKHIEQIGEILDASDTEVWLLTRSDRVATWKNEINSTDGIEIKRIVVTSVEAFVGQNITELAEFSSKGKATQFSALFELYNSRWVNQVGTPGIKIVVK